MAQMRVGQVDMSTGEMLEGAALAVVFPKRRNGFQAGWVAMAQGPMIELAKANLGGDAMRVMLAIVGLLDYENFINVNQAEIGTRIGMQRQNVGRAIRKLAAEGVLIVGPKVGRNATYRLNPSYGWKGSARAHHEALQQRMKARGMSVVDGGRGAPEEAAEAVDTATRDLFQDDA